MRICSIIINLLYPIITVHITKIYKFGKRRGLGSCGMTGFRGIGLRNCLQASRGIAETWERSGRGIGERRGLMIILNPHSRRAHPKNFYASLHGINPSQIKENQY